MPSVTGSSWGPTPNQLGDAGGVVTWSIAGAGNNISAFPNAASVSVDGNSVFTFDFEAEIRDAFAEWSRYGDIEFMQVRDPGGAAGQEVFPDIRVFFGSIPGNIIGWAFFPTSTPSAIAGDVLLENLISFNTNQSMFRGLALHEIGHAIGLDHTTANSVMQSIINQSELTDYDKEAIQVVYGPQDNAIPVYNLPDGQRNLDILDAPDRVRVIGNELANDIDGASGRQSYSGRQGNDEIHGRSGNDTLHGDSGNDQLSGGNNNDLVNGGSGTDTLSGGNGSDTLNGSGGRDTLNGGNGNDRLSGGSSPDLLRGGKGNDTLFGNSGDDSLRGRDGKDRLLGQDGRDDIRGENGDDRLNGGNQADTLFGNQSDDTLFGGAQNDRLIGGSGDDVLVGDGGSDVFVFKNGHGDDVVRDFNALSNAEKIDLSGVTSISNISELQAAISQVGKDTVIDTGGGNSIVLRDVDALDLGSGDFIF